jgi:hypothetical protein
LVQAAGIAGNFQKESSFDPAKIEGGAIAPADYKPISGVGFGLAQWTDSGRQAKLIAFVEKDTQKRKITDLSLQLDHSWEDFNTNDYKNGLAELKTKTDPVEAAIRFHGFYEGSGDTAETVKDVRGGYATKIYNDFKNGIPDSTTSVKTNDLACNGDGQPSQYIDGFAIYNQNDPRWDKKPYGTSTIGAAGCGPSAMAMIITALGGSQVTPLDTATYGAANGTFIEGVGSSWSIQTTIGNHWNLKSTKIPAAVANINESLRSGNLIITSGTGSAPYTTSGHYIVIRAVTSNGKWLIGDSNSNIGISNSSKEWDPDSILVNTAKSNIWAVSK